VTLVRLLRAEELTAVWIQISNKSDERFIRIREDLKSMSGVPATVERLLLRNKKVYAGQSNWTQAHFAGWKGSSLTVQSSRSYFKNMWM